MYLPSFVYKVQIKRNSSVPLKIKKAVTQNVRDTNGKGAHHSLGNRLHDLLLHLSAGYPVC